MFNKIFIVIVLSEGYDIFEFIIAILSLLWARQNYKWAREINRKGYLAYFIGLFIGDGFTNKYDEHHYITQFVGCKSKELEYYQDIFSKNSNKIFGLTPKISEDKKFDAIRINFYSKDMFDLITKRFNIKAGRKSHDVLIPDEILNRFNLIQGDIVQDQIKNYDIITTSL